MKQVHLDPAVMSVVDIDKMSEKLKKAFSLLEIIQKGLHTVHFADICFFAIVPNPKTISINYKHFTFTIDLLAISISKRSVFIFLDFTSFQTMGCWKF